VSGPQLARGCLPFIVALLIAVGLATVTAQADGRTTDAAKAPLDCNTEAVMNHRLDELGRSGYVWVVAPLEDESHAGETDWYHDRVVISPDVDCDLMPTVVNHEWMHVQQAHAFPSGPDLAYHGRTEVELIADCGSQQLGSTYLPYLAQHRQATGDRGCPTFEAGTAAALIVRGHSARW
jgi:hypothetical protein